MSKPTAHVCSVDGCDRAYRCSGYCGLHYDRVRRYGSPDLPERAAKVCNVEDCGRAARTRGYCDAHYGRLHKYGDVLAHIPLRKLPTADERDDIETRILAQCTTTDEGCIEWQGMTNHSGYGTISWRSRAWVVHRAIWTVQVGPIPTDDDWTIDHLCFNRRCVNVKHLEVVTRIENSRRGGGLPRAQTANKVRWANATECPHGHARTPANVATTPSGERYCIPCRREAYRKSADKVNAKRRADYARRRSQGIHWREARLASSDQGVE